MKHRRPKPFLTSATSAVANEFYNSARERLQAMSTAEMRRVFAGIASSAPVGSGGVLTGLSSTLATSTPFFSKPLARIQAWSFGTVHRNKMTDECVMVVGYRQVIGLREDSKHRRGWMNDVGDTVDDWWDYWDVEPDT